MPRGDVGVDLPFDVIAQFFIELTIEIGAAPERTQPQRNDPQMSIHDCSARSVARGSRRAVRHAGTKAAMPATPASASAAPAHVAASVGASWNSSRDAPRDNARLRTRPAAKPGADQPRQTHAGSSSPRRERDAPSANRTPISDAASQRRDTPSSHRARLAASETARMPKAPASHANMRSRTSR